MGGKSAPSAAQTARAAADEALQAEPVPNLRPMLDGPTAKHMSYPARQRRGR